MKYYLRKQAGEKNLGKKKSKQSLIVVVASAITAGVALVGLVLLIIWITWQPPIISPISPKTTFSFFSDSGVLGQQTEKKVVYGFLPYWNVDSVTINSQMTHLAYFGLTIGSDGTLETQGDDESLMGYQRLQSEAFLSVVEASEDSALQLELVVKQFNSSDARAFLKSKKAQETFFSQLDSVLLAYPFTGVNLDIELVEGKEFQQQFTEFVRQLKAHLDQSPSKAMLSIDVYPSAALGQNLWNLAELEPYIDYLVVMAYDFHRRQSIQAGPVSPLLGGDTYQNINQHLKEILELVPGKKILLGVPFYGYEWRTTSRDARAMTYPDTGATASYQRVLSILDQKDELKVQENWNDMALSPYLTYQKSGETYVLYYENPRSLSYKLDYVNQLGLAGIAIWALGYEGTADDLWQVIDTKLTSQ